MDSNKPKTSQTYSKSFGEQSTKLVVFYNGQAQIKNCSWSINGFLNHEKNSIQEVIFMQGYSREHDSFHVWYKENT